ncbi:hypothetical protein Hanom_Chr09g00815111 [Helianthus anomalus]
METRSSNASTMSNDKVLYSISTSSNSSKSSCRKIIASINTQKNNTIVFETKPDSNRAF